MRLTADAILCGVRAHGETGTIVRLLTAEAGLVAAFVAGGRGRLLRPVLIPGNRLAADIAARTPQALPYARVELVRSRAPFLAEPLPAAAIGWATTLTAATLPEQHPYPPLFGALDAVLEAVCVAPSARGWVPGLLRYERLLLRELGYGDIGEGAGDGTDPDADLLVRVRRQGIAIARGLFADRSRASFGAPRARAPKSLADRGADVMGARERLADLIARILV